MYENAILEKRIEELDEESIPPAYKRIFSQSTMAYSYYRHSLVRHVIEKEERALIRDVVLLEQKLKRNHYDEYYKICEYLSQTEDCKKFHARMSNVIENVKYLNVETDEKMFKINTNSLRYYQSLYELDEYLINLAYIATLLKYGIVDYELNRFKDKNGNLIKGRIITFISNSIKEFPTLKAIFDTGYNNKLRNLISHNNYQVENEIIESLDRDVKIYQHQFFEMCYKLQEVQMVTLNLINMMSLHKESKKLKEYGIIGIGYIESGDCIYITLFQIWCFGEHDDSQEWLKECNIVITDDSIKAQFTELVKFKGEMCDGIKGWLNKCGKMKKIKILTVPIIPSNMETDNEICIDGCNYSCLEDRVKEKEISINISETT